MMKEEPGTARTRSGGANVACEDFPLPFRIEQIPVGFELLWVDVRGVIGNPAVRCRTDIVEDILLLRIGVVMLLLILI